MLDLEHAAAALTDAELVEMYRRMLRIRHFDERAVELQSTGVLPGPIHTSIGQEATVVGACMALRDDDYMTGNHRSHGHPIGKGSALPALMAELLGKSTGICRGKGGSMHLADFSVGSLGESGIVGAGIPIAVGAALSAKMRGTDQVCLSFFGDGASNSGPFHEALNLAAIWNVPAIFLCENNAYSCTFSVREAMVIENVADRAMAYGMPGAIVDGQDALEVHRAVAEAVARARAGGGPSLIEAKTYRYREHAEYGGLKVTPYRSKEEEEQWRARDPIGILTETLVRRGILTEADAQALEAEVADEAETAVAFAKDSPLPEPVEAYDDLFVTTSSAAVEPGAPDGGREITYLAASYEAITEEMRRDDGVLMMGQDLRSGLYGAFPIDEFAVDRIRSLPISETGFVGAGVGAAMTGLRPIVDITTSNFLYSAMDQVVNQAAKLRYMSGGQAKVPLLLLANVGYGASGAAHHSDRPFALFANSPGLKILAPSTPYDVKGLMKAAIREEDPVLLFRDNLLWGTRGPVPEGEYLIPIGVADVKREGSDVTVVAIAGAVRLALAAARELEAEGVSVEVVDPRTLVPLDREGIAASIRKTGRVVVVDPAPRTCGFAAELVTLAVEECSANLRAAPVRVTADDVPIPFSPPLERQVLPDAARLSRTIRELVGSTDGHRTAVPLGEPT